MNEEYNFVQYVIPKNVEIFLSILPHTRHAFLRLKSGKADVSVKSKQVSLQLMQDFPMPIWESLWPCIKAKTACDFLVHGNHYVFFAAQKGLTKKSLFAVFPSENTFSFVVEKHIQLQIFPVDDAEQNSNITIRVTRGSPEISGYRLSAKVTYPLTPYNPVLIKSSDEEPYSVYIHGLNRKVRLSLLDENYQTYLKAVREHIFTRSLCSKKFNQTSPIILILGPKNVGKTTFCQLLVNDALEKKIIPVYVDLNIQRSASMPGSLSLTEIRSRIDSSLDFKYNIQRLLHFGALIFHPLNIRIYYHLVRKMGWLLSFHQKSNDKLKSLVIIDTNGCLVDNNHHVECILESFPVNLAVVIGDQHYYDNLKQSVLKTVPSEFIPKSCDIEPQNDYYEASYSQYRIRRYFFGPITRPFTKTIQKVNLERISIYNILAPSNDLNVSDEKTDDFKIERVICGPCLQNHILAVSAAKRVELFSITEIKYYVCFIAFDMSAKTATVLVPEPENFQGGILLMGHVKRIWN